MKYFPFILLICLCYCDKYTGYDYSAESIGLHSKIYGKVTNIFNRNPVKHADMEIGSFSTVTDDYGNYSIEYIVSVDQQRDKPIPIRIFAENYYSLDTTLVLYPPEMKFNIEMVYAAPIIEKVWLGIVPFIFKNKSDQVYTLPVTQVLVYDYQKIESIDTVYTVFYYEKMGSPEILADTVGMDFISPVSLNQGYYQAIGGSHIGDNYTFHSRKITVVARDNEGYQAVVTERDKDYFVSEKLFPIIVDK